MKMQDMRRSKAEKRDAADRYTVRPAEAEDYHHGLHVELDHDSLEKLGMHDNPKVGAEVNGQFMGRVVHASHAEREDGPPERHVRVLMHHIGMESDGDEDDKPRAGLRQTVEQAAAKKSG
jgi:hypothetical protein